MAAQDHARSRIAAGYARIGTEQYDFALARYTHTGQLDGSFGEGGKVHTDFMGLSDDFAAAAALRSDGKIVAVGSAHVPETPIGDFALARYFLK